MFGRGGSKILLRFPKQFVEYSTEPIKLDNVLLFNKMSRLEMEKRSRPDLNDEKMENYTRTQGLDYEDLVKNDEINKKFGEKVRLCFEKMGVSVKTTTRLKCTSSDVEWCDAIFPIGGDGTFLHTARWIINKDKPVIGFNSNPSSSEGFLCLPEKYSTDIELAIRKLLEGKFKWMFRTRIRVNMMDESINKPQFNFHDEQFGNCELEEKTESDVDPKEISMKRPILALNEVFISEVYTGRVSYFEMRVNNSSKSVKIKSSGLCVCTGTGSTSWHSSINSLNKQDVYEILKLYIDKTGGKTGEDFETLVANLADDFNQSLTFECEDQILGYSIRDLITLGVWPNPKGLIEPRGFAESIEVKSKCQDAGIIVDGGTTFPFNEGTSVYLETRPEDALRTVVLLD